MEKAIHSAKHRRLCTYLRDQRIQRGLSQTQLAAVLGVPQSFISSYENAHRRLDLTELEQIAIAVGVTLQEAVAAFDGRQRS